MVLLRQRLPGSFMCDMLRPDIRYTADTIFHFSFHPLPPFEKQPSDSAPQLNTVGIHTDSFGILP